MSVAAAAAATATATSHRRGSITMLNVDLSPNNYENSGSSSILALSTGRISRNASPIFTPQQSNKRSDGGVDGGLGFSSSIGRSPNEDLPFSRLSAVSPLSVGARLSARDGNNNNNSPGNNRLSNKIRGELSPLSIGGTFAHLTISTPDSPSTPVQKRPNTARSSGGKRLTNGSIVGNSIFVESEQGRSPGKSIALSVTPDGLGIITQDGSLPRPLSPGLSFATAYTPPSELLRKNLFNLSEDAEVHLTEKEARMIYQAKCQDQNLQPVKSREARFMEVMLKNCSGLMFSLREHGLGFFSAKAISQVLSHNTHYSVLDLSGNRFRDEGAECIADLLRSNDTIVRLNLRSNDIGPTGSEAIFEALRENNTLTALDLSGISGINRNHIGLRGAQALGSMLSVNPILSHLNLGSNGLGEDGMRLLAEGLRYNQTLVELDIGSNNLGVVGIEILVSVLASTRIEKLNLERNSIGDRGAAILAKYLATSAKNPIAPRSPTNSSTSAPGSPASYHASPSSPSSSSAYPDIPTPAEQRQKLQQLQLQQRQRLESLDLSYNKIMADGIKALCEAISRPDITSLKMLQLEGNGFGDEGALEVAQMITANRSLTQLIISRNEIEKKGGMALGAALCNNPSITYFDIGSNMILDDGAKAFAECLRSSVGGGHSGHQLTYLDISNNRVTDDGGNAIAEALKRNQTLHTLLIKQNRMCAAGEQFAEALKHNKQLLVFDFTYNDFSYKSYSFIVEAIKKNAQDYKARTSKRLKQQIRTLQKAEDELMEVSEAVNSEIYLREKIEEECRQNKALLEQTVSESEANLNLLREELKAKQGDRKKMEEDLKALMREMAIYKAEAEAKVKSLQNKISVEANRASQAKKNLVRVNSQLQEAKLAHAEQMQPYTEKLQEEQAKRDRAKEDAKYEEDRLEQAKSKLAALEKIAKRKKREQSASISIRSTTPASTATRTATNTPTPPAKARPTTTPTVRRNIIEKM